LVAHGSNLLQNKSQNPTYKRICRWLFSGLFKTLYFKPIIRVIGKYFVYIIMLGMLNGAARNHKR